MYEDQCGEFICGYWGLQGVNCICSHVTTVIR